MTTPASTADTTALFMLHGCLRSTPGNGQALAGILAENDAAEPMPGCRLYLVATDPEDPDAVWVTEVWDTEEDHQASLQIPAVQERIQRALPIIDRDGMTSHRLQAVAGIPR
ncbi:putative quinol monooxygenase [Kocuria marina]|uniref:putative quinol monooxygenase n=1 Tax=Kocuria marina TaxID=223184 RepID=UPI0022E17C83|nr:antibiotic biosynthesis monooxygenase [Kocuria marina]